ncbi:MAG: hypothetical protein PV344_05110 [Anaplasma sp.]|nr:hypothetical protein [Anaplasma sp.]
MLTYCPNCSRDLFFANHRRFAKFAKTTSFTVLLTLGLKHPMIYP